MLRLARITVLLAGLILGLGLVPSTTVEAGFSGLAETGTRAHAGARNRFCKRCMAVIAGRALALCRECGTAMSARSVFGRRPATHVGAGVASVATDVMMHDVQAAARGVAL